MTTSFTPEELAELAAFDVELDADEYILDGGDAYRRYMRTYHLAKKAGLDPAECERLREEARDIWRKNAREIRAWLDNRPNAAESKRKQAIRCREYYAEHRDEIRAYQSEYRRSHMDEIRARQRKYYLAHQDDIRAYKREYRRKKKAAASDERDVVEMRT